MKKAPRGPLLALLAVTALVWAFEPAMTLYARTRIAQAVPGARVTLGRVGLSPAGLTLDRLAVRLPDWRVEGNAAVNWAGEIRRADLHMPLFRSGDFEIRDVRLRIGEPARPGEFRAGGLRFKKLSIDDIRGVARIHAKTLTLEPLGSSGPYGLAAGSLRIRLEKNFEYEASAVLHRASPAAILHALEWDGKASLSGLFNGSIALAGNRAGLSRIEGTLDAQPPGGELNITHRAMFEDLAARTQQPVELIEAGFSSYHFDTGRISVSAAGPDLQAEILLEGPAGKRRLQPVVHDFFKKENG